MKKDRKKTLTRDDLAKKIYPDLGIMKDSSRFVTTFFEVLSEQIAAHDELKIHGFGRFQCIHKRPRIGRNPKTGEPANISARRVVSFIAGGRFKQNMQNDYYTEE